MKLKITFDKSKCIGNGACLDFLPSNYKLVDNKLIIPGAKSENNLQVIEAEFDDFQKIVDAGLICPVNAFTSIETETGEQILSSKVKRDKEYEEVKAEYDDAKEFIMDEKGYFLIRVNKEKELLEVAYCSDINHIRAKVYGTTPIEVYQTILRKGFTLRADHAAYLGRELQKAYTALKLNIDYVQDDELKHNNN